jgi:hypothetical protein
MNTCPLPGIDRLFSLSVSSLSAAASGIVSREQNRAALLIPEQGGGPGCKSTIINQVNIF